MHWHQTLPEPAAKTVETRAAFAGEALRKGKTYDTPKRLKKRVPVKLAWRVAEGFSVHLPPKLTGCRGAAARVEHNVRSNGKSEYS
ncbi:MAG: hypothetical protein FWC62_08925 [Firmicutes bacterium]|nr:hypothetical protein [Bacillota bacterium]